MTPYQSYIASPQWTKRQHEYLTSRYFTSHCESCSTTRGPFSVFHRNRASRRNYETCGLGSLIAVCRKCADGFGVNDTKLSEDEFKAGCIPPRKLGFSNNVIKPEKRAEVERTLLQGYGIRATCRLTRHHPGTVTRIYRELGLDIRCACGRESIHRGWCHIRVKHSPARLAFLAKWLGFNSPDELYQPKKKAKPVPEYIRPEIPYERETEIPRLEGRFAISLDAGTTEDEDSTMHSRVSGEGLSNTPIFGKGARSYDVSKEAQLDLFAATLSPHMREVLWDIDSATDDERETLLADAEIFKLRDYITA